MQSLSYWPPLPLHSGVIHTVFTAYVQRWGCLYPWQLQISHVFHGAEGVPLYGEGYWLGRARGTIIATYGITGDLQNQWYLHTLAHWAIARRFDVVLFDWRAHGRSAELSPVLTSDGLYEGQDFVAIAQQCQELGYTPPYWFVGYSLGGQLALWGAWYAQQQGATEIGGAAVICPNLDSNRSLAHLGTTFWGRQFERAISRQLQHLARHLHRLHPQMFDLKTVAQIDTIAGFDAALVIDRLGFASVAEYYAASSPLPLLPQLTIPVWILYAVDDPLFDPCLVPELLAIAESNPALTLLMTEQGGHVGFTSDRKCQQLWGDPDYCWGIHRLLDWLEEQTDIKS
ncbi:alpha/beta fold hydrolase [Thermosynechococcus sp. HN-54]|uniref:YheT family hydrolase n=1 Tax=Thermosynechococcus sp. HN-54 TaxID=2933959 RepID=UPI00202CE976|nr:alpha/beta fold hydrolase [Thermosynechococcus sp. HN-54]URR36127.1 alpha/beta fold hydrolase [Thermosynechococcus sp. HN-54]